MRGITDEHVKVLVKKCNKLTDLILESKYITNKSVTNINEHLPNLEKLKCFKLENWFCSKELLSMPMVKEEQSWGTPDWLVMILESRPSRPTIRDVCS